MLTNYILCDKHFLTMYFCTTYCRSSRRECVSRISIHVYGTIVFFCIFCGCTDTDVEDTTSDTLHGKLMSLSLLYVCLGLSWAETYVYMHTNFSWTYTTLSFQNIYMYIILHT